jgi:hypothetical protein
MATTEGAMKAKPGFEHLVEWAKAEMEKLKAELAALESGVRHMGTRTPEGDWEDVTPKYKERLKELIVAIDDLIIKYSFPF